MAGNSGNKSSRRDFIKLAAGTLAVAPFFSFPTRTFAGPKNLKIAKWAHFLPEFDTWFEGIAREWGKQHSVKVSVDLFPVEEVNSRATAEVKAGQGHDVFMFPWPPAEYLRHVIDHAEVYQMVAEKYGQIDRMAHRSTFDWQSKQYFAFADSWIPAPLDYFADYWGEIGMPAGPLHYYSLHTGAKNIREKFGVPCGLALAPTLESNVTLHTILYAFNSFILDASGKVAIGNARTGVALEYVKSLYQDAGTPAQLTWGPGGNVKAMLARKTSCTINGISLVRMAERQNPELAKNIILRQPLLGSAGILAVPHVTNCSAVWKFAQNQEAAKQFLADLIDNSKAAYENSRGCNFPFYQKTVPDLIVRLQKDADADPVYKYTELKDALHWTRNLGFPGYATPASMAVFNSFVIPRMFIRAAKGESSPGEAMVAAAAEIQQIVDKWKQV